MKGEQLEFEAWLTDMPDALERFLAVIPQSLASVLDFSPQSLDLLERWLLDNVETVEKYKAADISLFDGCPRYIGETFRRNAGGSWDVDLKKKSPYFGLPVLQGPPGSRFLAPVCPHRLVTAAFDRRTGTFFRTILAADA